MLKCKYCEREVKGYKRDRDIAKWTSFNGILTIVDVNIIHKLEQFSNIEDFINKRVFSTIGSAANS